METLKLVAAFVGAAAPAQAEHGHVGSSAKALAAGKPELIGATPEAQAQVDEWLQWASSELSVLTDDKLMKVNEHLSTRTFLVGNTLTLADVVIYGVTQPATTSFPAAQILHFAHLLRWADLVQARVGAAAVAAAFPKGPVVLSKVAFVPPPPPAPPAAAPAKAAPAGKDGAAAAPAAAAGGKQAAAGGKADGAGKAGDAKAAPAPAPAGSKEAAAAAAGKDSKAGKEKAAAGSGEAAAAAGGKKEKGGEKAAKAAPAAAGGDDEVRIDQLDIRVGKITKVQKHPNADALYLEEIDVGEPTGPRQVISGLVKFVPVEEMQDRVVVVVCNLKPAKMREVMSYGMVLCASNDDHDKVVPVAAPAGAVPGDRVTVAGFENAPLEEVNPKKKILERLFPDMKTDADGVPCFKGVAMEVAGKGKLSSPLANAWVK